MHEKYFATLVTCVAFKEHVFNLPHIIPIIRIIQLQPSRVNYSAAILLWQASLATKHRLVLMLMVAVSAPNAAERREELTCSFVERYENV